MSKNGVGIIFDGDDTLWDSQSIYVDAKKRYYREMATLGFDTSEVEQVLDTTDIANVDVLGFSRLRFPKSMVDAYRTLCERRSREWDKGIAERLRSIGESVFHRAPHLFPGATNLLDAVRARGARVILATKGDHDVQKRKLAVMNLAQMFHRLYILDRKTENEFRTILAECDLAADMSWSLGNSVKSDINPALRVGMNAIWVQQETWEYERELPERTDKLFVVRSLPEALTVLMEKLE